MTRAAWRVASVIAAAAVGGVLFLASQPLIGLQGESEKRLLALEEGQRAIVQQLQEIRALMQAGGVAPAAAPLAELTVEGAPSRGRPDAVLTMVEFSDFECPFCASFTRDTRAQLEREFVDTGKVRMVFRHFPLESIHPNARRAAEASECAHQQDRFWPMHALLFEDQRAFAPADLTRHAKAVGLDMSKYDACLTGVSTARVRGDLEEGARAGITGTPTFFVGQMTTGGKLRVLHKIVGAVPYADFKSTLDELLAAS